MHANANEKMKYVLRWDIMWIKNYINEKQSIFCDFTVFILIIHNSSV